MTVTSSTAYSQTITSHTGNWSSSPITVGTFTELTLDVTLSSLTDYTIITFSRVDAFGNVIQLWGAAENAPGPAAESVDIGACDAYACPRAFGDTVQIDIITSGTVSGTISLIGKG